MVACLDCGLLAVFTFFFGDLLHSRCWSSTYFWLGAVWTGEFSSLLNSFAQNASLPYAFSSS